MGQAQCLRRHCRDQGGFVVDTDDRGHGKFAAVEFDLGDAAFHVPEIQRHGAAFGILFEHLALVGTNRHVGAKPVGRVEESANSV